MAASQGAANDAGAKDGAVADSQDSAVGVTADGGATSDAGRPTSDGGSGSDAAGDGGTSPLTPPAPLPVLGEVLVSEIMFDRAPIGTALQNTQNEWSELCNASSATRLLSGLTIAGSAGESHTIASTPWVTIPPHAFQLLAVDATQLTTNQYVPRASTAYQYSGINLALDGGVALSNGSTILSKVSYGGWVVTSDSEGGYEGQVVGGAASEPQSTAALRRRKRAGVSLERRGGPVWGSTRHWARLGCLPTAMRGRAPTRSVA